MSMISSSSSLFGLDGIPSRSRRNSPQPPRTHRQTLSARPTALIIEYSRRRSPPAHPNDSSAPNRHQNRAARRCPPVSPSDLSSSTSPTSSALQPQPRRPMPAHLTSTKSYSVRLQPALHSRRSQNAPSQPKHSPNRSVRCERRVLAVICAAHLSWSVRARSCT